MERKVPFEVGEYYHVYNRGVDKQDIFRDVYDWERFFGNLFFYNSIAPLKMRDVTSAPFCGERHEPLVDIVAYAILPNHFHIILREIREGGVSKFMSKFCTSHATYINTKYKRSGPLMCHPFRSKHIYSDEYFRWVFAYVLLNPVDIFESGWKEKGLNKIKEAGSFLRVYKYSSYPDYFVWERLEAKILTKTSLPFPLEDLKNPDDMLSIFRNGLEWKDSIF